MDDALQREGALDCLPLIFPSEKQTPTLGDFTSIFSAWGSLAGGRDDGSSDETLTDYEIDDSSTSVESVDTGSQRLRAVHGVHGTLGTLGEPTGNGVVDKENIPPQKSPLPTSSPTTPIPAKKATAAAPATAGVTRGMTHGGLFEGLDFWELSASSIYSKDNSLLRPELDTDSSSPITDEDDESEEEDDVIINHIKADYRRPKTPTEQTRAKTRTRTQTLNPQSPEFKPLRTATLVSPRKQTGRGQGGSPKRTAAQDPLKKTSLPAPHSSLPPRPSLPLTPLPLRPAPDLSGDTIEPLYWASRDEKLVLLRKKLKPQFSKDALLMSRLSSSSAVKRSNKADASGSIHAFVDLSNIVIGFYVRLRALRKIPQWQKLRAPPFFFGALALIIERDRPAVRKVTAGSVVDNGNRAAWPRYMEDAAALGYEMNILSRVARPPVSAGAGGGAVSSASWPSATTGTAISAANTSPRRRAHARHQSEGRGNSGRSPGMVPLASLSPLTLSPLQALSPFGVPSFGGAFGSMNSMSNMNAMGGIAVMGSMGSHPGLALTGLGSTGGMGPMGPFIFGRDDDTVDEYGTPETSPRRGSPPKMGEQAVDEILQLKMCHSVLDYDPGTIVLATGDAAVAEFSDGFLRHVERALNRGWRVELLSWKSGISQAWRELERKQKKESKKNGGDAVPSFRIIELDNYAEELLGIILE